MVSIVEAIMLNVVAQCGDQQGKHVSVVKTRVLRQVLIRQYEAAVLSYITTVQIVVVLDASLVLVVDLHDELEELVVVNHLMQIVLFEQRSRHKWHLHVPADRLREVKDVERERVNALVEFRMLFDELLYVVRRQIEVDPITVNLDGAEVTRVVVPATLSRRHGHKRAAKLLLSFLHFKL